MSVKVRAIRGCCIGAGRHLKPGEVASVDDLTAAELVQQLAVELVDDRDAPRLRQALRADIVRQQGNRIEQHAGSPWVPLIH